MAHQDLCCESSHRAGSLTDGTHQANLLLAIAIADISFLFVANGRRWCSINLSVTQMADPAMLQSRFCATLVGEIRVGKARAISGIAVTFYPPQTVVWKWRYHRAIAQASKIE